LEYLKKKKIERDDDKPWTPRRIGEFCGFGGLGPMPVGTPEMVADVFEEWLIGADVDGFNIQCKPHTIQYAKNSTDQNI